VRVSCVEKRNAFSRSVRPAIATLALALCVSATAAEARTKYAAFAVDAKTGKTLYASHADGLRYPASLTKIMTLYILFEEMKAKRLSYTSRLKVSRFAAAQSPSKLGLKPGSTISVRDAILALVTKSANDVAVVVAEAISGTQPAFARRMTSTARSLGMKRTVFRNASGLPDRRQHTTARDMARLGRAIQDRFPHYYKHFSTRVFTYRGRRYGNHNRLLGKVRGVDGIKTGYTRASGFNLVTSIRLNKRHIVAVVLGGRTGHARNVAMRRLIAKVLRKATRRRRTAALILPPKVRAARNRPVRIAKPLRRPDSLGGTDTGTVTASVSGGSKTDETDKTGKTVKTAPAKPTISPNRLALADTTGTDESAAGKAIRTASETKPENKARRAMTAKLFKAAAPAHGWTIQIGAVPSHWAAAELMKDAKSRAQEILATRSSYTETIVKNDATLYRVRFAGFENKSSARSACEALKQRNFACFAVYQ